LARISHRGGTHTKSSRGTVASGPRQPFAGNLGSLNSLLHNSTIGVAFFDGNLHCRGFNGALRRMLGVSPKRHTAKHLHKVFPGGTPKLELAFRRVWTTGNSLLNLEWTAQLSEGADPRRWVVNLYPVTDDSRQVRLVATTFSEVTKGRCVEWKLSCLRDKFHSQVFHQPVVFGDEFSDISTRTFELVTRSIALLKSSLRLRFRTSRAQLGAALVRHALYMTAEPAYQSALAPALPYLDSGMDAEHSQDTQNEADPLAGCPSPRERQILRLLADRAQVGAALVRHALYMTADSAYESALTPVLPLSDSDMDAEPSEDMPNETDPLSGRPSPRERQVLRFLADGKSSKEIASILDISTRTVECYRARVMLKLGLHSTAALVRYAVRNNIVEA
jgi:DNA-binding CsgD family transcriptional regulator